VSSSTRAIVMALPSPIYCTSKLCCRSSRATKRSRIMRVAWREVIDAVMWIAELNEPIDMT